MKRVLTLLVAAGLLAGTALTAGVGCGDTKPTTKTTKTGETKTGPGETKAMETKAEEKKDK
jgi:hypothetical protein